MCAYIKHAHPTVYEEAYNTYEKLNTMYPNTRDLRKTPYFINIKKGVEKEPFEKKPSGKNSQGDKFTLKIPLLRVKTQTTTTSSSVAASFPFPVVPSSPSPVVPSSPSPVVPSSPSPVVPSSPSPVVPSSPSPVVASAPSPPLPVLSPVPSEVYQTLLEELQQDPQLYQIFNNFPLQEMDKLVAEDIGDIDDISPLEVELR